MANNNDVVTIELGRTRVLRFGHKALKKLSALTNMSMESMSEGNIDFEQMEVILFCGLLADAQEHGENLQLEDMEDLLDKAPNPKYYMDKMTEAFSAAFGSAPAAEGNEKAGK